MAQMNTGTGMLGILGGQGACASAVFHERFVRAWALMHSPTGDEGYPEILHFSTSLPGLTPQGLTHECAATQQALVRAMSLFRQMGVTVVAAPCNSLLGLSPEATSEEVLTPWACAPVPQPATAVLCSASLRARLEGTPNLLFPSNDEQRVIQALIESVIAGEDIGGNRLDEVISAMRQRGALAVRVSCTELSCLSYTPHPFIADTMNFLIDACVLRLSSQKQA